MLGGSALSGLLGSVILRKYKQPGAECQDSRDGRPDGHGRDGWAQYRPGLSPIAMMLHA